MATSTSNQRLTKPELAKQVAAHAGLTAEQAKSAVDAVFDTIASDPGVEFGVRCAGDGWRRVEGRTGV